MHLIGKVNLHQNIQLCILNGSPEIQVFHLPKIIVKFSVNPRPWHNTQCIQSAQVMGWMIGPNNVIAKDVQSCTFCCYVRCTKLSRGNAFGLNRRNLLTFTVLEYRDNGCAMKGLVVCSLVQLGSMKGMDLMTYKRCAGLVTCSSTIIPHRNITTSLFFKIYITISEFEIIRWCF